MRLRIVFFVYDYYPRMVGGAARQARLQALALCRRGHKVTVVCPDYEGLGRSDDNGVEVLRLPRLRRRPFGSISHAFNLLRFLLGLRQFDICHVHGASAISDAVTVAALLCRRPVFVKHVVTSFPVVGQSFLYRSRLLRLADMVQALTPAAAAQLTAAGIRDDRLTVIPNGLQAGAFCPATPDEALDARRRLDLPADRLLVLYVGKLTEMKGTVDLLNAWPRIDRALGATLVLVGWEPNVGAIDFPMRGDVIVRSATEDVASYYQAADVFVMPGYDEGQSNALLEAMASGLPVVATASAASGVVQHGLNGLITATGDPEALARSISRLVGDSELRAAIGHGAATSVPEHDIDDIAARLETEYIRLLERKRS